MDSKETLLFLKQSFSGFGAVGAVLPTMPDACQAICADAVRRLGNKSVLEVGPGTGPITTELARHLRPGDELVLCEIDPYFVDYLKRRFDREPLLARVRDQVEFVAQSVVEIPGEARFDYIISAIPFTLLQAPQVVEILETYRRLLKPGGTLTFLEYAWIRKFIRLYNPRVRAVDDTLRGYIEKYQFRLERIYLNFPPADVRSLRFVEAAPEDAMQVRARWNSHRLNLPGFGMAKEALDAVLGFGGLAWWAIRAGRRWWPLPALAATVMAWFHRDPRRHPQPDPRVAYSACDGTVMKVDTVRHPRLGDQQWTRIAVFLSPANVHINRAPIAGRLADHWDEPGGFMPAYEDASELNASRYVVLEGPQRRCAVAQRAGFLARRIITWPRKGELLAQGERYGLIRLGSRTDVLLPHGQVEVNVQPGDRVVAGQTVLARWLAE